MKITSTSTSPSSSSRVTSSSGTGRSAATTSSTTGAAPAASAADPGAQLSQLEAQFAQADFNAGKVNEVTAAIAAGKYQVNTGAIADKLLQSTAALGRSGGTA